jgi:SulP family sulfate permease
MSATTGGPEAGPEFGDRPAFAAPSRPGLVHRALPFSARLRAYRGDAARHDLLAALTVAALAVPASMAYAEVAGVSPINGLYALLLPAVVYALLGSSREVAIGPEGSASALVGAAVIGVAAAGSEHAAGIAAALALLIAAWFLVARLLRLSWIADYLSRPVLVGYLHGVAVVLIISQLPKLLGIDVDAHGPLPTLMEVIRELGDTSTATLAVGATALGVLLALRTAVPAFPAALAVLVASIAVAGLLDLGASGVALVGAVPSGLPALELPSITVTEWLNLIPTAGALFAFIFADGILTARAFAGRGGEHVRAGQELVALGAANAAAGISQGFPVAASNSRTAINQASGVRTQISGLMAAAVIVVILLFLTGPIADVPKAVLGAAIVTAAIGLVQPAQWRALRQADPVELAIAAVTTAGVIISGVLQAVTLAIALSIVDVVRRSARPHDAVLGWVPRLGRYADVSVHPEARTTPGVVVYRLDDRLFFANAGYVKGRVHEAINATPPPVTHLVFDAEGLTGVDSAGLLALGELTGELAEQGIELEVARLKHPVHERLEEAGLVGRIGADRFHPTVRAAVAAAAAGR